LTNTDNNCYSIRLNKVLAKTRSKTKMKGLFIIAAVLVAVNAEDFCTNDAIAGCTGQNDDLINCNASFSGFALNVQHLQAYANDQISKSFDYLLLAANFGTHVKNRPGFEKQFRGLSDTAWSNSIKLIKHITKRGGAHDFYAKKAVSVTNQQKRILEVDELNALALALDVEKTLALEAHRLHERYSHANSKAHYDAEVAHYLEEEFIEDQAGTVRRFSGYINDLKRLIQNPVQLDTSLAVYLFDEYLQKQ